MKRPGMQLLLTALLVATSLSAETASDWLDRSIRYHDPRGLWGQRHLELTLRETRPEADDRHTVLKIGPSSEDFHWLSDREGRRLEGSLESGTCRHWLDGSEEISVEDRKTFRLDCDRLHFIRNYYVYLWGLPMKLRDPGTLLDSEVERVELEGRSVISLRVTYEQEVGEDTWYFYLDPDTAKMVAYRFYHDEDKGDGELIMLDGEVSAAGMRLPRKRTWTTHLEGRLLGSDILEELRVAD